jgi:uncharacterized RDD family membrane protein YckC
MVDSFVLASDIAQTTATYALPPLLWLFLYLFAWERPETARASGFGRTTFWLLLPGSLVGSVANAPVLPWAGSVLAINIGGGLVPLVLSALLLRRALGRDARDTLALYLGTFAAACTGLFVIVLAFPPGAADPGGVALGATVAAVLFGLALVWGVRPRSTPEPRVALRAFVLFALTLAALVYTFHTTESLPGYGIASVLPWYLVAPAGLGVASVALARPLLGLPRSAGLAVAYATATFGVLVGADVLREPPLYGGAASLLAIGGAGLVDLLYLTGLLAVVVAYVTFWALERAEPWPRPAVARFPGPAARPALSPSGWLRAALRQLARNDPAGSVRASLEAARSALGHARGLRGLRAGEGAATDWNALAVPAWVASDYANLEALATRAAPVDRRDAERALVAARLLVRLARDTGSDIFASAPARMFAFAIDLAIVTAPAVAVWVAIALWFPGSALQVLGSLPFATAVVAFGAYAFLLFVFWDLRGGTPGKRWRRLAVVDRAMRRPSLAREFVRDAPKILPLSVIAYAVAPALVLLVRAGAPVGFATPAALGAVFTGGALLAVGAGALALIAAVSAVAIAGTAERQRLGDYLAGTWVVRRRPTPAPPPGPQALPAPPAGPAPPPASARGSPSGAPSA